MTGACRRHGLHVYRTAEHLVGCVAAFALQGLERGEPAILVPARANRAPLVGRLRESGFDVDAALAAGRLVLADADELVQRSLAASPASVDGMWESFRSLVASLRARGARGVTVWGEGPDRLLKAGHPALFTDLERRWCDATRNDTRLNLLCSYRADPLDASVYDGELQAVCALHSHVLELEDAAELGAVVESAVAEVLGARMTGMAWSLADAAVPLTAELPLPFARLLWLKEQMPSTWGRVLALARAKVR